MQAWVAPHAPPTSIRLRSMVTGTGSTRKRSFRGSCFVEFADVETAAKVLEGEPKKYVVCLLCQERALSPVTHAQAHKHTARHSMLSHTHACRYGDAEVFKMAKAPWLVNHNRKEAKRRALRDKQRGKPRGGERPAKVRGRLSCCPLS
jgi:hypothetical protein